jgi:hypothetical protein
MEATMTIRYFGAAALGCLLGVAAVRAQDPYYNLRIAQQYLQAAADSLQAAPADAPGHRNRAVAYVNKALEEIHVVLSEAAPRGRAAEKAEHREEKLERKEQLREQHLQQKEEEREERMDAR